MNILSNAIDALEEDREKGNYPPQITISTRACSSHAIEVAIADNGKGMPESVRQKIFDPFFTTKPVGKGTGMGLPISYQIVVDMHQGRFDCRSTLDEGTEFIIQIPTRQSANGGGIPPKNTSVIVGKSVG